MPQLRIAIQCSDSSFAIDVRGRTTLELHLPRVLGSNSILLGGNFHVVTQTGIALQALQIDFDDAEWSIPLPFGIRLTIYTHSMHVSLANDLSPVLEMRVGCSLQGLPSGIQDALGQTSFEANIRWSKNGASISATTLCESLPIGLPSFPAFAGNAPWDLGELILSAKYLRMSLGSKIECSLDISLTTPSILHEFLQSNVDFRVTTIDDDVRIELLSSPFRALECKRVPTGSLRIQTSIGGGKVYFDLPSLHIDWNRRRIVARGHIAHRGVKIPLGTLRSVLERAGLHVFAQHLPDSIAFQSFGLPEVIAAFSDLTATADQQGTWSESGRQALKSAITTLKHLPQPLRDELFQDRVPKEVAFHLECSFDFDLRIHFSASSDPARIESSPLRLLVPMLGLHGPELLSIKLYRWALGEIHVGQVFTLELDAEIESIELSPRGLISGKPTRSHLVLRDVVALIGQSSGIPWILPSSFRKVGWQHTSVNGMNGSFQCEMSLPKVDRRTLIRELVAIRDIGQSETKTNELLKEFECRLGPVYLRLPRCLGGNEIGSTNQVVMIRTPTEIEQLLIAWQTLDVDRFLAMIPSTFGERNIEIKVAPEYDEAMQVWSSVVEQLLHVIGRLPMEVPRGSESLRFPVRLERVTRKGLHFQAEVPDMLGSGSRQIDFDLPWLDLQGE